MNLERGEQLADGKALTSTQMGVDTHVPCRTTQALPFAVRDVLLGLGVPILLCHPKIDDVDDCTSTYSDGQALRDYMAVPLAVLVPGRPMRKLSGLISR